MKSDTNNYLSLLHFFSKSLFLGIGISKIIMIAREGTIISIILGSIIGYFILSIINNLNDTDVRGIWMVAQALYAKQELEKQKEKEKEKQ